MPEPEVTEEPEAAAGPRPSAPDAAGPGPQDKPEPVPATAGPATGDSAGDSALDESALGGSSQVTVVPGIARYHRTQCILIRFLGSDDLETMTREAAENAALAPCRACQPDQGIADS